MTPSSTKGGGGGGGAFQDNTNTKNRETTTTTAIMSGGIGGQKSSESSPLIIKAPGVVTEKSSSPFVSKDLKLFENGGGKKDDDDDAEKNAASAAVEDKEEAQPANKAAMNFMMDDSELTEEQQRVIAERVAALQNRFKKSEEKSTENKRDELVMQHGHLNLNANEATMILKVCDMNELDAEERLRRVNDLYQEVGETSDAYLARILDTETGQFLTQIRDMVMEEEYAKKTLQKNKKMRKISEQRIARKIKRLSNKKLFDEDGNEIVDSDLEAWEEYDNEQFFEEYVEVPVKEERAELGPMLGEDGKDMVIGKDEALDGVKFVRHERKADNSEKVRTQRRD